MPTGVDTYIRYKRESGVYTGHDISGDATWKVFGHGLKATPSISRTKRKITGLGSRQATAITTHEFTGNVDLTFELSNPWWLRLLTGNVANKVGVAAPYTYYWLDTANESALGALALPNTVPAFTIENGLNLAVDSVRLYKGALVATASLSVAIGGDVDVKLSCPFRTILKGAAGIASDVPDTFGVMTFVSGSLKMATGVTLASVQNVSLNLSNNTKPLRGLGSDLLTQHTEHEIGVDLKASMLFLQDSDVLDVLLGGTTVPTTPATTSIDLVFDNGLSGANQQNITFKFTGVEIQDSTIAQAIENPLVEDFTPIVKWFTLVKAINSVAAEP